MPLTINWGERNTLIMFSDRDLAEQFAALPTLVEVKQRGIVKGRRAEKFIEGLGMVLESGWIKKVLVNPNPFHEWLEGRYEGYVADAAKLYADLKEVYRDFLDD